MRASDHIAYANYHLWEKTKTNWLAIGYRKDQVFISNWEKHAALKLFLLVFIFLLFCPEISQGFLWEEVQVLFCLSQCHCHLIHGDRSPSKHQQVEKCVVKCQWKHFQVNIHPGIPKVARNNAGLNSKSVSESKCSHCIRLTASV